VQDASGEQRATAEHTAPFAYDTVGPKATLAPLVPAAQFCPSDRISKSQLTPDAWSSASEATVFATNERAGATYVDATVNIEPNVWSLRLRLQDGVRCCRNDAAVCATTVCAGLRDTLAIQVRRGLFRCTPCSRANRVYCRGSHGCRHSALVGLSPTERAALDAAGVPREQPLTYVQLVRTLHVLAQQMLRERLSSATGELRVPPPVPAYYSTALAAAFAGFDSTAARDYRDSLSDGTDDAQLRGCAASRPADSTAVDYSKCAGDAHLRAFGDFVKQNYWHDAFVRVPGGNATVAWNVRAEQLLGSSVYAFAGADRPLREKFVEWLLDFDTHCEDGDVYNSICRGEEGAFSLMNPWVGGDFNPVDFCDTLFEPGEGQRIIDSYCNRPTCPGFYAGRPQVARIALHA
jgi:hypothetical protein